MRRVLIVLLLTSFLVPVAASRASAEDLVSVENPVYCAGNEVKQSVQEKRDIDWAVIRYCIIGPH